MLSIILDSLPLTFSDRLRYYMMSYLPIYKSSDILLANDYILMNIAKSLSIPYINTDAIIRVLNYANKLDNDMNVFDLLPLDILKYILLMLPRQSIKYMFQISTVRRKLNLQEVLNSRKLLAYPRESSYCEMHHIPASIIDIQNFV